MLQTIVVGLGGFVGAILRYWLSGVAQRWSGGVFPIGTLLVNVLGCLAMGTVIGLVEYRQMFGPYARGFITIGVLGGLTTFSTFGYETFVLLRDSEFMAAVVNIVLNVAVGTAAVLVGWIVAKAWAV